MSIRLLLLLGPLLLLFIVLPAEALMRYTSGPPSGYTGAPTPSGSEAVCTSCHSDADGGSTNLNDGEGSLTILAPERYTPGEMLTFTVQVKRVSAVRFGFQVVVKDAAHEHAGVLNLIEDSETQFADGIPTYVTHDPAQRGDGEAQWTVNWMPPVAGSGPITIYAVGNAANGIGAWGDFIYTASLEMQDATTTAIEVATTPGAFTLEEAYPNPFAGQTTIPYTLSQPGSVFFTLYDAAGRVVREVDLGTQSAGSHHYALQADELGNGLYLYEMRTASARKTQTLLLIR